MWRRELYGAGTQFSFPLFTVTKVDNHVTIALLENILHKVKCYGQKCNFVTNFDFPETVVWTNHILKIYTDKYGTTKYIQK